MTDVKDVQFSPDKEVQAHKEGMIKLVCANFRSHEDGLPEWLKNSSDMYFRREFLPKDTSIVLLFSDNQKNHPKAVGCLDFGGMTIEDIETRFRNWGDPDAAGGENQPGVEGGHGNGGKCYMTQLFESHAYIHTLREGRASRYGFKGGDVTPGYFPSVEAGRGYDVGNAVSELQEALIPFGLTLDMLPDEAKAAFEKTKSFTLVAGFKPKHVKRKIKAKDWIAALASHQQVVQTIQRNQVSAIYNGELLAGANPIRPPEIEPIPGHEEPRVVPVPPILVDPDTQEDVETHATSDSRLVLRTSASKMTHSLKPRHTINGWTHAGRPTGGWAIPDLSTAQFAKQIYGDLYLEDLYEYKQNDRRRHSNAPLIRAITNWLRDQVDEYSLVFVTLEKLQASQAERDELSRMNSALNDWKNRFLEEEFGGANPGDGGSGPKPPPPPLPVGDVAFVELRLTHGFAGQGVSFRPTVVFRDARNAKVRAVPFEIVSSNPVVAAVDPEFRAVTTGKPGLTVLQIVCKDTGLQSNPVPLEVVEAKKIRVNPLTLEVGVGSRGRVNATITTTGGRQVEGAYLLWNVDNDEILSVGAGGLVVGHKVGVGAVAAMDDQTIAEESAVVTVVEREVEPESGNGFPRILLSEIDKDPLGNQPPVFSQADPPVHQRVVDVQHNIWWINMASPLARRYIDTARDGGAGSPQWRAYLLERYIEIMVRIMLTYEYDQGEEITFDTMLRRWDEEAINMQSRVVDSLQKFLDEGAVPEGA